MPSYTYTAFREDDKKNIEIGTIDADSTAEARQQLRKKGLIPTTIKVVSGTENEGGLSANKNDTSNSLKPGAKDSKKSLPRLSLGQRIDFTTTIHALLSAGVPILEALMFVQHDVDNKKIQITCEELKRSIISGSTFAVSIAKHPNVFDKVYIGLIKAGEDSGEMEDTMGRLIELLKKQQIIKSKVIGALMYPAFLILVSIAAVTILLTFVFPAFEGMFAQLGGELPLPTKICMAMGKFIKSYWYIIGAIVAALIGVVVYLFKNPKTKRLIDIYSLKIPLINSLLVESNLSNFLSVLQVSYDAGIPIVECLRLAGLTLDNQHLRENVSKAIVKVQQGVHLSSALRATNAFPSLIMFLMSAGEQSGQLGEMLNHCVIQIDKRLDDVIDRMTKMIEPLMLIIMGFVVLFIALALYMPMFKSYTLMT